jgi:hypothetical protein
MCDICSNVGQRNERVGNFKYINIYLLIYLFIIGFTFGKMGSVQSDRGPGRHARGIL